MAHTYQVGFPRATWEEELYWRCHFDGRNLTGAHLQKESDPNDPEQFQLHVHEAPLVDQVMSLLLQSQGLRCFFGLAGIV